MPQPLPYLSSDLPGIGGRIKERPQDFRVEEVPLYLPQGEGTHLYFRVTKQCVSTPAAVERIARHMCVKPSIIGVAGLKDAQAVTTQMMSLEHADAQLLSTFRDDRLQLEIVGLHNNKLRTGHLKGNRFVIRLRGVGTMQLGQAQAILQLLSKTGIPNFFGEQRFGRRGDTAILGATLVRGQLDECVRVLLGRPQPEDSPACREARQAFDAGELERAAKLWPYQERERRLAINAYLKRQKPEAAVAALDPKTRRLYVSALQSEIFNEVLRLRLPVLNRIMAGDLAQREGAGKFFRVEDEVAEQARADIFAISATGPMLGTHCQLAEGKPGEIERAVLQQFQLSPEDFVRVGKIIGQGTRRPLRFRLIDPQIQTGEDAYGEFLELAFTAPSGCYATVVLREIMKTQNDGEQNSQAI